MLLSFYDIACPDVIQFLFSVADMAPTQSPTIAPTGPTVAPSFTPSLAGDALQVLQSTQVGQMKV